MSVMQHLKVDPRSAAENILFEGKIPLNAWNKRHISVLTGPG